MSDSSSASGSSGGTVFVTVLPSGFPSSFPFGPNFNFSAFSGRPPWFVTEPAAASSDTSTSGTSSATSTSTSTLHTTTTSTTTRRTAASISTGASSTASRPSSSSTPPNSSNTPVSASTSTTAETSNTLSGGAIAGIVIGAVAAVALLILAGFILGRRRARNKQNAGQIYEAGSGHRSGTQANKIGTIPELGGDAAQRPAELASEAERHEMPGTPGKPEMTGVGNGG